MGRNAIAAAVLALLLGCSKVVTTLQAGDGDPNQFLEEVESDRALNWVKTHNEPTLKQLENDARFAPLQSTIRGLLTAEDRIHWVTQRGEHLYNFLQDGSHKRGLLRRTTLESYMGAEPAWESVLDVDALAKKENKNWVFKAANCLEPEAKLCLIALSDGGKDASVLREFNTADRAFVDGGFSLPEAKSDGTWLDENRLLVATDFGPGSLTLSGYARIVKVWTRGTPLSDAKTVFEGLETDVSSGAAHIDRPEGSYTFVFRSPSFFEQELFLLKADLTTRKVPFPISAQLRTVFQNQILATLREDWKTANGVIKGGSLVSMPLGALDKADPAADVQIVFEPTDRVSLVDVVDARSYLVLNLLDNVKSRLVKLSLKEGHWTQTHVPVKNDGAISIMSSSTYKDTFFAMYESFLVPSSLYLLEADAGDSDALRANVIKTLPSRFSADGLESIQLQATSRDGTQVPYFVVMPKQMPRDGSAPTLLYGYGGFEQSMTPSYLQVAGKARLEKGGVYVLANIRGGGEFGPEWHRAGLKENRQRVYDDFIAIAEDLIARKITSPAKLGIAGGSNGGLLMGVMLTQRPDLFKAIVCQVPLLDMLRYHKLLAGNSWMGEYGNPDIAEQAAYIRKYSPYQNLAAGKNYPKIFFMTSTKDDRVHPGHARKMAARMESMGYPFFYYENTEGGHGAAANLEQRAHFSALMYTYLYQQLLP